MANMELSRQEYPSMLSSLAPSQAVNLLNDRVKQVGKLNSEIADWLLERRKVEEAYALGLKRLSKRQPPDDTSELGIFATPWHKIVKSTESIASSHQLLAQKIEVDVERPLREFISKNREMQSLSTIQGNLGAIAKELESVTDKADKKKKKSLRTGNDGAVEVERVNSQWESQAPYVFENLQAVDETRINHLRDVLTQLQTHEADQVERNRVTAEDCLNSLLNIETADEIQTFVARSVADRPTRAARRTTQLTTSTLSPPRQSSAADDGESQVSRSSTGGPPISSFQEGRSEKPSGLKRLGTVIGRRRQHTQLPEDGKSPNKKSTSRFGKFGKSSRDEQPVASPNSVRESSPFRPPPRASTRGSAREPETGLQTIESPQANGEHPGTPPASLINDSIPPQGSAGRVTDRFADPAVSAPRRTDSEGFTIPQPSNDVISQAQQDAASELSQSQYKLDIRKDPIQEEGGESAFANVASHLRAQQLAPRRQAGTLRGRRDVRNTIFVPSSSSPDPMPGELPAANSPIKSGRGAPFSPDEVPGSDSQSIRSSRSLSSLVSTAVRHPEMALPGLNSSVVETVSASFENGRTTHVVAIGEMALVYNPSDLSTPSDSQHVRLENFAVLEKVAPNPSFVSQLPERSGEYTINLGNILRNSIAFKYQVHLDEGNSKGSAPLLLSPSWKIEPTQTSIILNYSLNPAFTLPPSGTLKMQNVVLSVNINDTKITTCQSKPTCVLLKERSLIYWRIGDLTLDSSSKPVKLLARLTTESEARAGHVDARWEISGESAIGLGSGLSISQLGTGAPPADPFADEGTPSSPAVTWRQVPISTKLISGKYSAA